MRFFKGFRARAFDRFMRLEGCEPEVADLATVGIFPFENRHPPATRRLERKVRSLSHEFNRHVWSITDPEALRVAARTAVKTYLKLAEEERDEYYRMSWMHALDAIARPGEDSGLIFSHDSVSDRRLAAQANAPGEVDLDASKLELPGMIPERAVELMLERVDSLTPENAKRWIKYETLRENWHYGWLV
jgi:hypothetical protein